MLESGHLGTLRPTVLVFAEQREMEENGQRLSVGSEDDKLRDTSVQGLRGFVRTLLELAGVLGGLDKVEELLLEFLIGQGPS